MAWLYLLLVILIFYTPIVGLGHILLQMDLEISISGHRVPIPFTGTLRLLFWSLISWWALWVITRWLEKRTGFDVFYWLDQRLPFLHLRQRWIYVTRPPTSLQIAVVLAKVGLTLSLMKVIGVLLLGVLLWVVIPKLLQIVLPGLIESLVARFPEAGWVEVLVGWLSGSLMEWLADSAIGWVRDMLDELLRFTPSIYLFAVSILVLLANQAYQREREERHLGDIKRNQKERKRNQREMVISSSI